LSGFEAFDGRETNPTALLMESIGRNEISLPDEMIVDQIILPVTFAESYQILKEKIDSFNPDVVISFGLAAKREAISLESTAINKIDARIADNNGEKPENQRINDIGADTYLSTLPIGGFEGALTSAGLPVSVSQSAGEYVCNYVFYKLMEDNQDTLRLCGFIHVPLHLSQDDLKKAVSVMLHYLKYE
jgi:pyroglutamyl-peptidase